MPKKRYSTEEKQFAVDLITSGALKLAEVERILGYSQGTIRTWLPPGLDLELIRRGWAERYVENIRNIPR